MYAINKGINRSIEFRGIKAQYIIYLAFGLVALLLLFTILYLIGVNTYACLGVVLPAGAGLFIAVQYFSKRFGEHGFIKYVLASRQPSIIKVASSKSFTRLKKGNENQ